MSINVKSEFDMLVESIIDLGMDFDVVMVDPLYTTVKGDMSNNAVATDWIRNIRILKSYLNCAFIISNHEGKDAYNEGQVIDKGNATLFGSTFWAAFFNHNYKLKVHDGHHLLEIGKNRSGQAMDRIAMQMLTDDTLLYVPYEPDLTQNELKVVTMLRSGVVATARSVVESTGVSRATVFRILRKLEDKGQIEVVCDIKQTKYKWLVAGVEKSLTN
jgi:RecA-family ATPase